MRLPILASVVLGLATLAPAGEDEAEEIYRFEIDEPTYAAKVVVRRDRFCVVTFTDHVTSCDLRLAAEDLRTFEQLLGKARLREDPLPFPQRDEEQAFEDLLGALQLDPRPRTGALRLLRDGSPVESAILPWGRAADVARWLDRLTTEAAFLREMRNDKSRSCSLPGPEDVLHPSVRREALERALKTRGWPDSVMVALAQVVPCDEWVGVIEKCLRCGDPRREDSLVCVLACIDGETLPKEHRAARVKLLFEMLKQECRHGGGSNRRGVADALCRERFLPALPLIVRPIEERGEWNSSLHEFGVHALDPLSRLLESPSTRVREIAVSNVDLLVGRLDDLPTEERRAILDRMHVEFTLKIREIARHESDWRIRTAAGRTLAALALAVLGEDSGPEVFSFDGGDVRIKVRSNGRCEARFSDGAVSVDVKLTPDDLETFERLAGEARLREDPPPHVPSREEFGWGPERFGWWLRLDGTECWISMGERTADVARWLRRLTTEACFLRIVQDPESSFFLPDPENLLHPRVRKGSLERALAVWESPATIVDALARVASCEEWTRAVEERLRYRDEESVDSLAMALASCDELPTEHRDARARLLLEVFLREYAASDLDRTRRRAARSVADVLCHARCRPAIPIIIRMIERADEEVYDLAFEEYGVAAMDPLAKLLSSPNPFARRYAVRCVRSLADGIGGHADVLPRLRVEFTLKIREIARHDPDGTAQTLAGRTLPVIACAVFGG